MRILIVDDEPIARRRLVDLLSEIDGAEVAGEAADGIEALELIDALKPDAVLLDIGMPGLDGLAMARSGRALPPIIFTTAHDEFAIEAFEAEAIDYLLKPVARERLQQSLERVKKRVASAQAGDFEQLLERVRRQEPPRISAKLGDSMYLFDPREISRLRADAKYTCLVHEGKEYLIDESIGALEEKLSPWGFFRSHRSELINLSRVRVIHGDADSAEIEMEDGQRAAASRRRLTELKKRIGVG